MYLDTWEREWSKMAIFGPVFDGRHEENLAKNFFDGQ